MRQTGAARRLTHGTGIFVRDPLFSIDYERGLAMLGNASYETLVTAMRDELPQAWLSRSQRMCNGPTNVLVVPAEGFEYPFDYSAELVARGLLPDLPESMTRSSRPSNCSMFLPERRSEAR